LPECAECGEIITLSVDVNKTLLNGIAATELVVGVNTSFDQDQNQSSEQWQLSNKRQYSSTD